MFKSFYTPSAIKTLVLLALVYYFFGEIVFTLAKYTVIYLLAYVFVSVLAEASNPKKTTNLGHFFSLV